MAFQLRYCGLTANLRSERWWMECLHIMKGAANRGCHSWFNENVSWSGHMAEPGVNWVEYYRPSCTSREVIERNNEFSWSLLLWGFSGPSMELGEWREVDSSLETIMLLRGICKLLVIILFLSLSKITKLGRVEG